MKKIREYVAVCKSDMAIPRKEAAARDTQCGDGVRYADAAARGIQMQPRAACRCDFASHAHATAPALRHTPIVCSCVVDLLSFGGVDVRT